MLLLKLPTTGTVWERNRKSADPNMISIIHFHSGIVDFTPLILFNHCQSFNMQKVSFRIALFVII